MKAKIGGKMKIVLGMFFVGLVSLFASGNAMAGVQDFYFDDFEADYYLTRDDEGVSHLKVVEKLTAVFPDYVQNKGICRFIPNRSKGDTNLTLSRLTIADISVLRNGQYEPIYSIDEENKGYNVCTGTEDYVTGKQVYELTYEFSNVVTEFSGSSSVMGYNYQELYWDTNGTGWKQKFNNLTARLHFVDEKSKAAYNGKQWCYVGKYGEKGSERCKITETDDYIEFKTTALKIGENLTFDVELKEGAYKIVLPPESPLLLIILLIVALILFWIIFRAAKKYFGAREKRKFYKHYFVAPQYQPHKDYSLPAMALNYIGDIEDTKTALLIEMVVNKKIELIKIKDNKIFSDEWAVKVLKDSDLSEQEEIILKILNGGGEFKAGDQIEIKKRVVTPTLVSLSNKFDSASLKELKKYGFINVKAKYSAILNKASLSSVSLGFFIFVFVVVFGVFGDLGGLEGLERKMNVILIGKEIFVPSIILPVIITFIVYGRLTAGTKKYEIRSKLGLEMSRYMDGLELYIDMAEEERLKFLQSKTGAEYSSDGIVKLYEKLLPYAMLFGLEKSWMKELEKYYDLIDNSERPDWYRDGLSLSELRAATVFMSSAIRSSTTYSSGGSSSGSSGGGGGGFSGGGGGGGGGGGR